LQEVCEYFLKCKILKKRDLTKIRNNEDIDKIIEKIEGFDYGSLNPESDNENNSSDDD
jgi:hypothetical protein